LLTKA